MTCYYKKPILLKVAYVKVPDNFRGDSPAEPVRLVGRMSGFIYTLNFHWRSYVSRRPMYQDVVLGRLINI